MDKAAILSLSFKEFTNKSTLDLLKNLGGKTEKSASSSLSLLVRVSIVLNLPRDSWSVFL